MASHPGPVTLHLHVHPVHLPHQVPRLALVVALTVLALVLVLVIVSGGAIMAPDQLPNPRNLTTLGR
jgi:hypothetical protein